MIGEKTKIALVIVSYFVVSISMVLMNKKLLSSRESIPAPLFVTWYLSDEVIQNRYQCVVTALICWFLGKLGKRSPKCLYIPFSLIISIFSPSISRAKIRYFNCNSDFSFISDFYRDDYLQ